MNIGQDGDWKALVAKSQESVQNGQLYKRSHEGGFGHVNIGPNQRGGQYGFRDLSIWLSVRMGTEKPLVAKSQESVQNGQVYKRGHEGGFGHVNIKEVSGGSSGVDPLAEGVGGP